ncbi:MAG: hypothetical protein L6R39_006104 [Caloplaca ligustica]|nr:MAG: hypothetical protein L6R39_006104 [Caloplaca ligustica]
MLSPRSLFIYTTVVSLLFFSGTAHAATGQGSVSLFSDSGCDDGYSVVFSDPVTIALNLTLDADVCHDLPRAAHSYEVDRHPICDDGTPATFDYYEFTGCHERRPRYEGHHSPDDNAAKFDGQCLALVEFMSLAFLCEGIKNRPSSQASTGQASTSQPSPSQGSPTAGAAPETVTVTVGTSMAPSSSLTVPLYPIPGTVVPSGTGTASGGLSPTTGLPTPAPSPFTSVGSVTKASLLGSLALVVARILL